MGDSETDRPSTTSAELHAWLADDPGADTLAGTALDSPDVRRTADRGRRLAELDTAWPWTTPLGDVEQKQLDALIADHRWDGPLIVSMPRTGSTLLGTMLLLAQGAGGGFRFDRYIHEPVAPIFWEEGSVDGIADIVTTPLTPRDVVQESAYQFASREIAEWFLRQARGPVIFTMRDPRLAWPSRWRIMIREMLATEPGRPDAAALEAAVDSEDYSALGPLLTTAVDPPDNGWVAFLSVIRLCIDAGIDFVVVDNTRMRRTPEATMRTLCDRLGITYDESMTAWQTLDSALDRVVMGEMALDREYPWYYAGTLSSDHGIVPESRQPLAVDRFPAELRGTGGDHVSIDEAMIWYQLLLASDHCLP